MFLSLYKLLINRNFLLILALVLGFVLPKGGDFFVNYTALVLTIVMSFSISGIDIKKLTEVKTLFKYGFDSIFLNFIVHGIILLVLAYFFTDKLTFYGFVIIAATPPGVAVIPFTLIFKGNADYAFKGFLASYIISIILTPLIITIFTQGSQIEISSVINLVIQVILIPMLISRLLLIKPLKNITNKLRGHVVNVGFAIILFTAIALNSKLIISNVQSLIIPILILFIAIFVSGVIYTLIFKNKIDKQLLISKNIMLSIKSSGFSVATALVLFNQKEVAIPAAIMSIFVLLYLLFIDIFFKKMKLN